MCLKIKVRDKRYLDILNPFLKKIENQKNVLGIILYGSLAIGKEKPFPDSDIDLIIIAKSLPENMLKRKEQTQEIKNNPLIQDVWMTPKEFRETVKNCTPFVLDAIYNGIVLKNNAIIEECKNILKKAISNKKIVRVKNHWVFPHIRKVFDISI